MWEKIHPTRTIQRLDLSAYQPTFTAHSADAYHDPTYRAAVDAIARAAAKMTLECRVTFPDGSSAEATRPNRTNLFICMAFSLVSFFAVPEHMACL